MIDPIIHAIDFSTVSGLIIRGIILGSLYAILASGLTLVFGVMRVVNIAHGEFLMLGGYASLIAVTQFDINPLVSIPIASVLLFGVGIVVYPTVIEHIHNTGSWDEEMASLILTFGLSVVLIHSGYIIFSADFQGLNYMGNSVQILGSGFPQINLVMVAVALSTLIGLWVFLQRTRWGQAIRATSQNATIAEACGINTRRIRFLTFGLSAALASVAGSIVVLTRVLHPNIGFHYVLLAFAVVIIGGLGNVLGAIIAALLLGLLQVFVSSISTPKVASLMVFAIMFVILIIRPQGIMGGQE